MKERERNEDARGGDMIVNDSVASGRPDTPIARDRRGETHVPTEGDARGRNTLEEKQPPEKRD